MVASKFTAVYAIILSIGTHTYRIDAHAWMMFIGLAELSCEGGGSSLSAIVPDVLASQGQTHERLTVFRLIIIVAASRVPTMVIRLSRRRTFVAHRRFCLLAAISGV